MSERYQAIVIGNSTFPDLPELRCPLNDARGMAEMLKSEMHGPYEVSVLENEDHTRIYRVILRTLREATRDDRVLIYYAGHGKVDERDSNLYLAAKDTLADELPASSVAVAGILREMSMSRSRQLILILDCCYSGAVDKLLNSSGMYRGAEADQIAETLRPAGGSGSYILTASTSLQRAEEREGDEHGLLTKHVIAGIRDGRADRDDDGFVSMHELTLYVQDQVKAEGRQTPQCYTMREENGGLVIAKTGKAARSRKLAEVQESIYELAVERRASLRTVRASLNLLVPEAWWSAEEKAASDRFVDRLHASMRDVHRFIEVLEEAPSMVGAFSSGSRAAQMELERERDELLGELKSVRTEIAQSTDSRNLFGVRCAEAEETAKTLSTRSDELMADGARLAAELEAGKKQMREAETARATAEEKSSVAGKEVRELRDRERLLLKREKDLKTELAEEHRLRVAAEKSSKRIDQAIAEATYAEQDAREMRAAAEQERQRGANLQKELESIRKQVGELVAKLKAAETKEQGMRAESSAQIEEARNRLSAAEAEISPFKKQLVEAAAEATRKAEKAARAKTAATREQGVLAVLKKFKGEADYYVHPSLPVDKVANARQKCKVAVDSKPLALIDCTVFGSGKDCVLFDQERVYWHSMGDGDAMLYSSIPTRDGGMTYKGNWDIIVDFAVSKKEISLAGSKFKRDKLVELLKALYWNWKKSLEKTGDSED